MDYTLPGHPDPKSIKGRIVTLEFDTLYVVGTYVVNAGTGLKVCQVQPRFITRPLRDIRDRRCRRRRNGTSISPSTCATSIRRSPSYGPGISTSHQQPSVRLSHPHPPLAARHADTHSADLANPKPNWNKTPGYTEAETTAFAQILNPPDDAKKDGALSFVDMWRELHPETRHYTYFSYRFNCRAKGVGWRLDTCTFALSFIGSGVRFLIMKLNGLNSCSEREAEGESADV